MLKKYIKEKYPDLKVTFVHNLLFSSTNYIYSIYLARNELDDDIVLMHGDLVFSDEVLEGVLNQAQSCVVVDSTIELPEKDFKAVIKNGRVSMIGIDLIMRMLVNRYTSLIKRIGRYGSIPYRIYVKAEILGFMQRTH